MHKGIRNLDVPGKVVRRIAGKLRDVIVVDTLSGLLSLAVLVFSVTSMLAVGFSVDHGKDKKLRERGEERGRDAESPARVRSDRSGGGR